MDKFHANLRKVKQIIKQNHNQSCCRRKPITNNQNKLFPLKSLCWHGESYILSRPAQWVLDTAPGRSWQHENKENNMTKQETIAATMRLFMESGPSVKDYPSYKALNDAVGKVHGLAEGKCQALAGEKAWVWTPDTVTGIWRKATDVEFESRKAAAAQKNHGGSRKPKAMSDEDRAALDAQIAALVAVNNPALAPLLADLRGKVAADNQARKGSLKDRLAAAIDKLGLAQAVTLLEEATENA